MGATTENEPHTDDDGELATSESQHARDEGAGRFVTESEFEQALELWALSGQLTSARVAVLLVDKRAADREPSSCAELRDVLGAQNLVAQRQEGGLQVLFWNANQYEVDRVAGLALLRGGRGVRMGAAFVPDDATTAELALDVARCALRRASATRPLVYARGVSYQPPERRFESTSPAMIAVQRAIEEWAHSSAPIVLCGERGVGSEGVARRIHAARLPPRARFLAVNCALTPEALVERAVNLAFAAGRCEGELEDSEVVGTLYLSRLEALSPAMQSLLAERLRSSMSVAGQAAERGLVASTHANLHALTQQGRFNSSLYALLSGAAIEIPSLRERREDLAALAQHVLDDIAARRGRGPLVLGGQALRQLLAYPFPGNLPELRYELVMAAARSETSVLSPAAFSENVRSYPAALELPHVDDAAVNDLDLRKQVQAFEAQLIMRTLERCSWNQTEAARRLNVPRRTLVYKMRQLGIRRTAAASP